ncbi:hypothetical protein R1917_18425 [Citrobacter koseri]|nr:MULTISPECIES: hypothetical protein [Citrobacter]MDM2972300.1 hypothetical protein [Citrobacter sp. CK198]MDM3015251.1 hypothetical protein [Citrobacter sp. CK189]WOJ29891.1 hypothetical protein R1917_18425 [Citrobacter koseri]WOJ34065.1 hypothetical protein R1243_15975 [Citrobacter koseri]
MTLHPARGAAFFVSAVAVQILLPSFFAIFFPGLPEKWSFERRRI